MGELSTLNNSLSFYVVKNVSVSEADKFLQQTDYPTVWAHEFMRSMASAQHYPVMFRLESEGVMVAMALGLFKSRFLRSHLVFPSLPRFMQDAPAIEKSFWQGLDNFSRKHGVVRFSLNSFEAPKPQLPMLSGLVKTKERSEFYIDLTRNPDELLKSFSSSHRRNIKKAQKHDLVLSVRKDENSLKEHLVAFAHTSSRRQSRGETLPGVNEELLSKLLLTERAFMMQLHRDQRIISSMYIITTPKSAFYYSGGTTPEGTKIGAFQYLIWSAILELRKMGLTSLTLGGTDADTPEGLRRFKLGFDSKEVALTNSEYLLGFWPLTSATRIFRSVWHSLRHTLSSGLTVIWNLVRHPFKFTSWELYSVAEQVEAMDSDMEADLLLRELTHSDFEQMNQLGGRFADQAKKFFFARGISSAYGLYVRDKLAHISWVYTSEEYEREPAVQLRLRPGEAEITNCYTADAFRGLNLYPYAIVRISNLLLAQGNCRVYMKVNYGNDASKRGIAKAGFNRCGTVFLLESPMIRCWQGLSIKVNSS